MSEATNGPDESAFGLGGESSHDADIDAAYEDDATTTGTESADEEVPDSHSADVDAGYDDNSDSPTTSSDWQDT